MTDLPDDLSTRILDGSPDAVVVCDREGTVRFWNGAAERVFGFSRAEAVGSSLDLIIPERFRARHWSGWTAALTAGHSRYADGQILAVPALRKDGGNISIEFSIQLLSGHYGIDWVIAVIRDVTERYARDKALREQIRALKAAIAIPPTPAR